MKRVARIALLILTLACCAGGAHATGFYGPTVYLDEGGKNVDASPEFYWELEVKRLAREFHRAEKLVVPKRKETQADEDPRAIRSQDTAEADLKDFADALQAREVKPADPTKATAQHEAARALIAQTNSTTTATLPDEFSSEFADYHRGAFAFRRGQEHWVEARQAWEDLLKRPEQDRH